MPVRSQMNTARAARARQLPKEPGERIVAIQKRVDNICTREETNERFGVLEGMLEGLTGRSDDIKDRVDNQTKSIDVQSGQIDNLTDRINDQSERFDAFVQDWQAAQVCWWQRLVSWFREVRNGKAGENEK